MATAAQFRKLALAQPGAEEGAHMQHADFRTGGKIFAGLTPDEKRATLRLTPEVQAMVTGDPAFQPAAGAWGRGGWTSIELAGVQIGALNQLVAEAAALVSAKRPAMRKTKAAKATVAKAGAKAKVLTRTPAKRPQRSAR
jgi:predicted DNA-binding protein (MmcQ/YjbR family)